MATGETRTIDSDLTLTSKYEMTAYDDILNIIDATVTLAKPAGDLFTNEGDDTVTVTNSTITASALGLSFMLGSGDDTLILNNSTIDAPTLTGSGSDVVRITGERQSRVSLNAMPDAEDHSLSLGDGDDVLELLAILAGAGDINFGAGNDTLRFNGGSLLTTGTISNFSVLDVQLAGGTLGKSLTLVGENTTVNYSGNLLKSGSSLPVITIANSTTSLNTGNNVRTDVRFSLNNVVFTQSAGGTLEFAGHSGYAITANNSTVSLHDIVTASGQVLTGENTVWSITDSNFANSTRGINLTNGSLHVDNVSFSNFTNTAAVLNGTVLTGAQLAFTGNKSNGALRITNADVEITDFRAQENQFLQRSASGGGLFLSGGDLTITGANFSGNAASAHGFSSAIDNRYWVYSASGYASAKTSAKVTALGGGLYHQSGDTLLSSASLFGNIANASANANAIVSCTSVSWFSSAYNNSAASAISYASASATAAGGGLYHQSGGLTLTSANFSGNIANAVATATAYICSNRCIVFSSNPAAAIASTTAAAKGGGLYHADGDLTLTSANFSGNTANAFITASADSYSLASVTSYVTASSEASAHAYGEACAFGGGLYHSGGDITLTDAIFFGNTVSARASANASATASAVNSYLNVTAAISAVYDTNPAVNAKSNASAIVCTSVYTSAAAKGGGIYFASGNLNIESGNFSGNRAAASASVAPAHGGAIYADQAILNLTDTVFTGNSANFGGALYLMSSTLNYVITANTKLNNTNNIGGTGAAGGWLYMTGSSTAVLSVGSNAKLTVGGDGNNDSIAGTGRIEKQGTGHLLINSDVSGYTGSWTVSEGTVELARIARTIKLDDWTFGVDGTVILSDKNDTVNMTMDKKISVLDLGGGSDVINTNGYTLSNGELRISALTFTGGGRVSSTIRNRDEDAGFDLTCANITLDSDITGGLADDIIRITQASTLGGVISLGGGNNTVTGTAATVFANTLTMLDGDDTLRFTAVTAEKAVSLGDGNNRLTATGTAIFKGDLTAGSGNDTLSFAAVTAEKAVSLGDGTNSLTATGTAIFKDDFTAGAGNDTLRFADVTFQNAVSLGDGINSLTATGTANFKGNFTAGAGDDTLIFRSATFTGTVSTGAGDDTLSFTDVTFQDAVFLGDGDNSLTATGNAEISDLSAGTGDDSMNFDGAAVISGELALGQGSNVVYVNDSLTMTDGAVKIEKGGETRIIVYRGTTLTGNTLTVYSDAEAARDLVTMFWADQTELDKVRLVVSSDPSFETFEFAVELYNRSKSFTLDLEQGYFVQFQANDEDGWKQRLLDDNIAPDQVTGLIFTGKKLVWDATHDNLGGNGVKQYTVQIATDAAFNTVITTDTTTEKEYDLSGLDSGNYYFRVRAEDYTENIGAWSETVSGELDLIAPSRPNGGSSSVNGYDVTLSWNASSDTGVGVAGYEYRIASDSSFETVLRSGTTEELSIGENALAYGTYYWQVRAFDGAENFSSWSLSKNFKTVDLVAPTVPTNADCAVDGSSVTVIWDASADDELGSGLAGYTVQIAGDASFTSVVKSVTVTATEAEITGLTDGDYYLRIGADDNSGNRSEWSGILSFRVEGPDVIAPSVPTGLNAAVTGSGVDFSWTASTDDKSGVDHYELQYGVNSDFAGAVTVQTETPNYSVTSLSDGAYSWRVRSIDRAGNISGWTENSSFLVDTVAPEKPAASADITEPTNRNVTVSAIFSEDSTQKQYSQDNTNWNAYTTGVEMEGNGTVYFRGIDAAGNISEVTSYTVSNIDKIAPEAPIASADVTTPTNQDVTVTATFSDDSAVREYSLDGENFLAYDNGVVMQDNGTVYFRGIDAVGNVSEVTICEVSNIDKVAPEAPTASADITAPTNQNVTVTATFSDDSAQRQYSLDGKNFLTYDSGVVMEGNGTAYFRGIDAAGNISEVASYTVANIDRTGPEISDITGNDAWGKTEASITATITDSQSGIAKTYYTFNGSPWTEFDGSFTVTQNGPFMIKAVDNAGNEAYSKVVNVKHLGETDTTAPVIKSITGYDVWNQDSVTVEVKASDAQSGVAKMYYTFNGTPWTEFNGSFTLTQNGPFMVRVVDNAGNETLSQVLNVKSIGVRDTTGPVINAITGYDVWSDTAVTISTNVTDSQSGVAKTYYTFNGTPWTEFNGSFTVTQNGPFMIRAVDKVGNETLSKVLNVKVIGPDTTGPVISDIAGNDAWGKTEATITATITDSQSGVAKTYYTFNGTPWTEFKDSFTVTQNGPFMIKAVDNAGNETLSQVMNVKHLGMVDTNAPVINSITGYDVWNQPSVTVTVNASDAESGIAAMYYTFNGTPWTEFNGSFTLTQNGPFMVKVVDNAGNETLSKVLNVKSIGVSDTAGPVIQSITGYDVWSETSAMVRVVVTDSQSGVAKTYYTFNGTPWTEFNGSFTVTQNGPFMIKAVDNAGNETLSKVLNVKNICADTTGPVIANIRGNDAWNQESATVTADITDSQSGVAKTYYTFNGTPWTEFDGSFTVTQNGPFMIKAVDNRGNETLSAVYNVKHLGMADSTGPVIESITGYDAWSADSVKITAKVSDSQSGVAKTYYTFNGTPWTEFNGSFTVTKNGPFMIKAVDNAGNETLSNVLNVKYIGQSDTTAPEIESISWDKTQTVEQVTISVTASDEGSGVAKTYYTFNGTPWTEFDGSFTVIQNGPFMVKVVDKSGNETLSPVRNINNIIQSQSASSMLTGEELESWNDASTLLGQELAGAADLSALSAEDLLSGFDGGLGLETAAGCVPGDADILKFGQGGHALIGMIA